MTTETDTHSTAASGMSQLQTLLLESIRDVRAGKLQPQQAKAINEIGATLVSSARAEIEHARITKRLSAGFLEKPGDAQHQRTANGSGIVSALPANSPWPGRQHRISDEEPSN